MYLVYKRHSIGPMICPCGAPILFETKSLLNYPKHVKYIIFICIQSTYKKHTINVHKYPDPKQQSYHTNICSVGRSNP